MAGRFWTKSEEKNLVAAVKKASTLDEVLTLAQRAVPERKITMEAIENKLRATAEEFDNARKEAKAKKEAFNALKQKR